MINSMPQPPLLAFAPDKAPHLIDLGFLNLREDDVNLLRIKSLQEIFIDLC